MEPDSREHDIRVYYLSHTKEWLVTQRSSVAVASSNGWPVARITNYPARRFKTEIEAWAAYDQGMKATGHYATYAEIQERCAGIRAAGRTSEWPMP